MNGRVTFVGAGPGRLDWVTQAGRAAIARADTILVDALVSPAVLSWAAWDARIIDVGKRGGQPSMPQEEICDLLVEQAARGRTVVRLKGGDPGTFGRLPEEIARLRSHGIDWDVVPGISAAAAAAARAGISLTDRDHAASLTLLTGHRRLEGPRPELDWAAASRSGTGAVYMGILHAERNARRLIDQGVPPDTPVLIAEAVTTERERLVRTTLAELPRTIEHEHIRPPAIWIYGEVTRCAQQVRAPMRGTVAVFRPWGRHLDWHDTLLDAGWHPVAVPLQRYDEPSQSKILDEALQGSWDVIALSSVEAAQRVLARLARCERDIRALAGVTVVVPGRSTAAFLSERGLRADLVIDEPGGLGGLVARLSPRLPGRLLVVGDEAASPEWIHNLADAGWDVVVAPAYRKISRTAPPETLSLLVRRTLRLSCVWTSASQVALVAGWLGRLPDATHVAIGERTAEALRTNGADDIRIASAPSVGAVLNELLRS